jgi:hypothetical protein
LAGFSNRERRAIAKLETSTGEVFHERRAGRFQLSGGRKGAPIPTLASTGLVSVGATLARTPDWDRRLPLNREGAVQVLGPDGCSLFLTHCERHDGLASRLKGQLTTRRPIVASPPPPPAQRRS